MYAGVKSAPLPKPRPPAGGEGRPENAPSLRLSAVLRRLRRLGLSWGWLASFTPTLFVCRLNGQGCIRSSSATLRTWILSIYINFNHICYSLTKTPHKQKKPPEQPRVALKLNQNKPLVRLHFVVADFLPVFFVELLMSSLHVDLATVDEGLLNLGFVFERIAVGYH